MVGRIRAIENIIEPAPWKKIRLNSLPLKAAIGFSLSYLGHHMMMSGMGGRECLRYRKLSCESEIPDPALAQRNCLRMTEILRLLTKVGIEAMVLLIGPGYAGVEPGSNSALCGIWDTMMSTATKIMRLW